MGHRVTNAADHEVITLYPSLFSYTLDDRSGLSGSASLGKTWASAMERGFEEQHEAEGLFLFAFEPETMGLTQQRAEVLENFGRFIRTQNTWIVSLGDLAEWWRLRRQVFAELEVADESGYTIVVHNRGDEEVRGVSLDFSLDAAKHRILDLQNSTLDVWTKRDLEKMLLVIEALPPGSHRIRLQNPSIITTEAVEETTNAINKQGLATSLHPKYQPETKNSKPQTRHYLYIFVRESVATRSVTPIGP